MYARTTLLEIDIVRISLQDALATFEEAVLPRVRELPGFRGVYALDNPDGRAMLISFWDTAEQAATNEESGWYPEVLTQFATMFRSAPGRGWYEVKLAVPPVPEPTG